MLYTWSPESPIRSLSFLYFVDFEPGTTMPSIDWLGPSKEVKAALKKCFDPTLTGIPLSIYRRSVTSWACACPSVPWAPLIPWWGHQTRQECQIQWADHSPWTTQVVSNNWRQLQRRTHPSEGVGSSELFLSWNSHYLVRRLNTNCFLHNSLFINLL